MQFFGLKIMKTKRWNEITDRVAKCGRIYRKYAKDEYHHGRKTAEILLDELSYICTVENLMWDEVKDKVVL